MSISSLRTEHRCLLLFVVRTNFFPRTLTYVGGAGEKLMGRLRGGAYESETRSRVDLRRQARMFCLDKDAGRGEVSHQICQQNLGFIVESSWLHVGWRQLVDPGGGLHRLDCHSQLRLLGPLTEKQAPREEVAYG